MKYFKMENHNTHFKKQKKELLKRGGWGEAIITMNWTQFKNLSENTVHGLSSLYIVPVVNFLSAFKPALLSVYSVVTAGLANNLLPAGAMLSFISRGHWRDTGRARGFSCWFWGAPLVHVTFPWVSMPSDSFAAECHQWYFS